MGVSAADGPPYPSQFPAASVTAAEARGPLSAKWRRRGASFIKQKQSVKKNYRDWAHSLTLCTVAVAAICRGSACSAGCAKPNQKYLGFRKYLTLHIAAPPGKHQVCEIRPLTINRVTCSRRDCKTSSPCPCWRYFTQPWADPGWTSQNTLSCPG